MIRVYYSSTDIVPISITTAAAIILAFCVREGGTSSPRGREERALCSVEDEHQQLAIAVSNLLLIPERRDGADWAPNLEQKSHNSNQ